MIRRVIQIDQEKCNGCGICAEACHEGAIGMVNGKAHLLRDDYCDGLGDCLPSCPTGAISFIEREAAPFDKEAVIANMGKNKKSEGGFSGCPGSMARELKGGCPGSMSKELKADSPKEATGGSASQEAAAPMESQLRNWPVQIKLAPINAPYFDGANILIAADCTAFAYADFHQKFIKNKVTLIGCPKLDSVAYEEKLTEIFRENDIASVSVLRMEVPCCGGIEYAAMKAVENSGKMIPTQVVTITLDGKIKK